MLASCIFLVLLTLLASTSDALLIATRPAARRAPPVTLSLVRAEATPDTIDSMLEQAGAATGIVALHFTSKEAALSNALVERCATQFSSSMLYGGHRAPSLSWRLTPTKPCRGARTGASASGLASSCTRAAG